MKDLRGKLGGIFMAIFGVIALVRWNHSGELFFILLAARNFIATFFFFIRNEVSESVSQIDSVIAYISTIMPLIFLTPISGLSSQSTFFADLSAIIGFTLVAWSTIDLGIKIGVAPAKRGERVVSGVYRVFDHPMYLGYVFAQAGWIILNPMNVWIFIISVGLMSYRANRENRVLRSNNEL